MVHHLAPLLHAHDGCPDVVEHGGETQAHADDGDGHQRLHGAGGGQRGGQDDHGDDDDLAQRAVDEVAGGLPPQGSPGGAGPVVEGGGQAAVAGGGLAGSQGALAAGDLDDAGGELALGGLGDGLAAVQQTAREAHESGEQGRGQRQQEPQAPVPGPGADPDDHACGSSGGEQVHEVGGGLPQGHHLLAHGPGQGAGGVGSEPAQGQARDPVTHRVMDVVHEAQRPRHAHAPSLEVADGRAETENDQYDEPAAEGQPPSGRTGRQSH